MWKPPSQVKPPPLTATQPIWLHLSQIHQEDQEHDAAKQLAVTSIEWLDPNHTADDMEEDSHASIQDAHSVV